MKAPSSNARARKSARRLNQLAQHSQGAAEEVITAHLEFIDDWELVASARRAISRGKSAAFAWRRAVRDSADTLRALGDPRMSERVDDLIDLESQVLLALSGEAPGRDSVNSRIAPSWSPKISNHRNSSRSTPPSSPASASPPAAQPHTLRSSPPRWACLRSLRSANRC